MTKGRATHGRMTKSISTAPTRAGGKRGESKAGATIRFTASLLRPKDAGKSATWTFLKLPRHASAKLPSRSKVSVQGTLNGCAIQATLEPDGEGGHWLKVDQDMRQSAGAQAGDEVALQIAPSKVEPEPQVPPDVRKALSAATTKAREAWSDITPVARRDWIHWIVSAKQPQTRHRRIKNACDMLAKGKRRPCCFDRSGMYDKSLSCPVADDS
jgi:hypothetical protein